jgi:heat-inducible transcriptional repressor
LNEASNFLNAHVRGRTLLEAKIELEKALEAQQAQLDALTQKIIAPASRAGRAAGAMSAS